MNRNKSLCPVASHAQTHLKCLSLLCVWYKSDLPTVHPKIGLFFKLWTLCFWQVYARAWQCVYRWVHMLSLLLQ